MSITKEQWRAVQTELQKSFSQVVFSYQGKKILVRRELVKEGRFELIVYFDGTLSIGWGWKTSDHYDPLTEILWHKRTKSLYSPKKRAGIIKSLGKRNAKRLFPKLEEHMEWYEPVFSTAATLVRQYKKVAGLNVESIGFQSESATCN